MQPLLQDYSNKIKFQFSIILPLHNRLNYFESCLKSICQQQHQCRTEILLLDDASQTFSRQDIQQIVEKCRPYLPSEKYTIYYLRHPQNLGEYSNINWGIKLANSPWIYIVHDDDLLLENTLLWFEEIIQKQPSLDLVSGASYTIDDTDKIIKKSSFLGNQGLANQEFLNLFLANNPLECVATIYSKQIFEKVGYFKADLDVSADWELLRRVSKVTELQWYYLPQYIGACRHHEQQKSKQYQTSISDQYIWQVLNLSQHYFSSLEQRTSKKSRYWQCFQAVEHYFDAGEMDSALSLCLDIVEFSDLGDRLWLEVLNQFELKHKQQIYELMVMLIDKATEVH
ncbi:glycosyl transferase family 2 [[Leptolyngbya] sp. PCC 7376]|uniref:glycosyltransferase family 2 protein n=1 Tax=[Leptolyngbya] sp. PCC 7376 TaxID=111781 RepID=UPI00029EEF06|nr:glycosyltransferase [[Leptolyngbya] sp. PCC 7376]AFY36798.1 glycosyl transferase family 2 [[Leptolyngbya] sp. PCC 7376]